MRRGLDMDAIQSISDKELVVVIYFILSGVWLGVG